MSRETDRHFWGPKSTLEVLDGSHLPSRTKVFQYFNNQHGPTSASQLTVRHYFNSLQISSIKTIRMTLVTFFGFQSFINTQFNSSVPVMVGKVD